LGIPREEALQMSGLQVNELLLAHEFAIEEEKKRLAKEAVPKEALLGQNVK
jgi:hypothetical protein